MDKRTAERIYASEEVAPRCDLPPWPHDVIPQGGCWTREDEGKMGSGWVGREGVKCHTHCVDQVI